MSEIGTEVEKASGFLRRGEIVAIPTETVYGLAGNALNETAVNKIFTAKNRPNYNPLIVHVPSMDECSRYVSAIPEKARELAEKFWPGPLTLLLEKKEIIPNLVTAGLSTVAIRVPNHHLTLSLLRQLDFPLAAPSANPFGYISPTHAEHVQQQLGDRIPYILDGGACYHGLESTIVGFSEGLPVVYRLGAVTLENIEACIGKVRVMESAVERPNSPGQLLSHYAPRTRLELCEDLDKSIERYCERISPDKIGLVVYTQRRKGFPLQNQEWLSGALELEEAARNLYAALHRLDNKKLDVILAETFPATGLGRALNDRLQRAAYNNG